MNSKHWSVSPTRRLVLVISTTMCAALASCDKDPAAPTQVLALVACPAGLQAVNSPITLNFTQPLLAAAVTPANIVVTDARTGFEIPGSVAQAINDPRQVVFTPNSPFAFDTTVRIRVQNLLPQGPGSAVNVTVCNIRTELPPIRELYWRALPNANGSDLLGVSLVEPNYGYVVASGNAMFRYEDTTSTPTALAFPVYYNSSQDVSFVSRTHGFAVASKIRTNQNFVLETSDAAATFDTVGSVLNFGFNRTYFQPIPSADQPFGVVGGGATFSPALFYKYHPATHSFTSTSFAQAGGVSDISFTQDTLLGAASTFGARVGTREVMGAVFISADGGTTWNEVTNARAPDSVVTYFGIATRANGQIYVSGGNGYLARLTPSGAGYTIEQIVLPILNPDPANRLALQFGDVEFAPDDDRIGWLVGAQQTGVVNGTPQFRGIIFMTRDGGATWTRQGILGADDYGAGFPALRRIDVLSSTAAWAVGAGGTVIRFAGSGAQ